MIWSDARRRHAAIARAAEDDLASAKLIWGAAKGDDRGLEPDSYAEAVFDAAPAEFAGVLADGGTAQLAGVAGIGPLRFVRAAAMLRMEIRPLRSGPWFRFASSPASGVPTAPPWAAGFPFSLRVIAVDAAGEDIAEAGVVGADAEVLLRPTWHWTL